MSVCMSICEPPDVYNVGERRRVCENRGISSRQGLAAGQGQSSSRRGQANLAKGSHRID